MSQETNRLVLRYLDDTDLDAVFSNYANDDEVTKYLTWTTHQSIEDTKKVFEMWKKESLNLKKFHYFIEWKETHELIGSCSVVEFVNGNPEIGYVLGRKWWNPGFMTEACKKLIELLFQEGYTKILIKAAVNNVASLKVIQKCGFQFIKQEEVFCPLKNQTHLCNFYELYNNKLPK